ncbi:MAG: PfkB family carbohydrate kinase [Planctomycetota bacterium]
MPASPARFTVVGLGEALFDIFGTEQRLGGAPLNVAVHAHALAAPHGGRAVCVSRVGQDPLGDQLLATLAERDLDTAVLQTDPDRPTGRVYVTTDGQGSPAYDIPPNQAWDVLQPDPDLDDLAQTTSALTFGSLAQRDPQSRSTIRRFVEQSRHAIRLFDVNLRLDFYDRSILEWSLENASIVKLNDEELDAVCHTVRITADAEDPDAKARALMKAFKLDTVVFTRGKEGTRLITADTAIDGNPATAIPAKNADAVGAGDSVTAAILVGLCLNRPHQHIADAANKIGAHVASQPGGQPQLPDALINLLA